MPYALCRPMPYALCITVPVFPQPISHPAYEHIRICRVADPAFPAKTHIAVASPDSLPNAPEAGADPLLHIFLQ